MKISHLATAIAISLFVSSLCFADDVVILPEGTRVTVQREGEVPVRFSIQDETHFIVGRAMLDSANASIDVGKALQASLAKCRSDAELERSRKSSSGRWTSAKWIGVGAAIAVAFFAGTRI